MAVFLNSFYVLWPSDCRSIPKNITTQATKDTYRILSTSFSKKYFSFLMKNDLESHYMEDIPTKYLHFEIDKFCKIGESLKSSMKRCVIWGLCNNTCWYWFGVTGLHYMGAIEKSAILFIYYFYYNVYVE